MANGWRTTAIIFIILFVAETLLFGYVLKIGNDIIEEDIYCAETICGDYYDAYSYDPVDKICLCFIGGEIILEKNIDS